MSDWADFCEAFDIDPNRPDEFDQLLARWSREEARGSGVQYQQVNLKDVLRSVADPECDRCGGSGYIGVFQHISRGRCFKCLPDARWEALRLPRGLN